MQKNNSTLASNIFAGAIAGIMTVIAAISYATLIFSGLSAPYLQLGISSALCSATVIGLIVALRSSSPISIAGPDANISAIIAIIVASVVVHSSTASGTVQLTHIWFSIAVCSLVSGLFLFLTGKFKLGRWIRFIPYPVVGGFLAGTGWLLVRGSFKVMCGVPLTIKTMPSLGTTNSLHHWLPGAIFAVVLFFILRRFKHFLIMPSLLIGAIIITHIILWYVKIPFQQAMNDGWLLSPFPADLFNRSFASLSISDMNPLMLLGNAANITALMIVTAIVILLNAASIELTTRRDVVLDRELTVTGIANIIAAPFGALTGCTALSRTILNFKAGATSRISGVVSAVVCGIILLLAAPALSLFPRPVLGGLLLYLGLSLLAEWVVDGWKRLSHFDYILVLVIIVIIAVWGFLPGVGIGLIIACMLFAINYSRTGVIRHTASGTVFHSNVERSFAQQEKLHQTGDQIYIMQLQGYLFFGTAFPLLTQLQKRLTDKSLPPIRFVVLDFAQVAGLDSSSILSFSKLLQFVQSRTTTVLFVNINNTIKQLLEQGGCISSSDSAQTRPETGLVFPDLDYALQWCEDHILDAAGASHGELFADHFARLFPRPDLLERLMSHLERLEALDGFVLFEQGTPSNNLYFVESGSVTALLSLPHTQNRKRLRTMGAGTVIGEMGLYLEQVRSASVVAEGPCVLYRLSAESFKTIETSDCELAAALHKFFTILLSKRLLHANEELAMLGR